jgi:hypothetical protein
MRRMKMRRMRRRRRRRRRTINRQSTLVTSPSRRLLLR